MKTQHICEEAFAHYRAGAYDEAFAAFVKAIELYPADPFYYMGLGLVQMQQEDLEAAKNNFSRALQMDNKLDLAYYHRSVCNKKAGLYTQALEDINNAIKLRPRPGQYLGEQGRIKHLQGDHLGALLDLIRAIKWDYGYNYVNCLYRSLLYMDLNEYDLALDNLGDVLRLKPNLTEAYLYKIKCHEELGEKNLAEKVRLKYRKLMNEKNIKS